MIFDDKGAYLRNNVTKRLLKELVININERHYHTTIYLLCQTYKSLKPDLRKLLLN